MRKLILAALLLFPFAASAQSVSYTKPPNVPTLFVQDYNVTIAVWVTGSGVGTYIAEFELHPDGKWYFGAGDSGGGDLNFDQTVANAGGPLGWLQTIGMARINPILAARFPPIGGGGTPPGTSVLDQVNTMLGNAYAIKSVNGVVGVAPK